MWWGLAVLSCSGSGFSAARMYQKSGFGALSTGDVCSQAPLALAWISTWLFMSTSETTERIMINAMDTAIAIAHA